MRQYKQAVTSTGRTFTVEENSTLRVTECDGESSYISLLTNSFTVAKSHVKSLLVAGEKVSWFEVYEYSLSEYPAGAMLAKKVEARAAVAPVLEAELQGSLF